MNKITPSIAATVSVALVAIIVCMTVIVISGHDVTIFVVAVGLLLTSGTGFVGVFLNQKRTAREVEKVRSNTNGTLSRVLDAYERAVARESVMASTSDPRIVTALHENTLRKDEIDSIREKLT